MWIASLVQTSVPQSLREAATQMPRRDDWDWLRRKACEAESWDSFVAAHAEANELSDWLLRAHRIATAWQPRLADGLEARVRPLREQWEARAPGFLRRLSEQTNFTADFTLELSLVAPICGGFAEAHLQSDSPLATMEALLYHPTPQIPEPVRIGWLVLQWAIQRHRSTTAPEQALGWLADASRHVEWITSDDDDPLWPQLWRQHWSPPT